MTLPDIFVLRHGETEWNSEGRWQGALDSDLTDTGLMQAVAIGESLGGFGVSPESHRAIVGPQGRAWQTAELGLKPTGISSTVIDGLQEIEIDERTGLTRYEMAIRWPDHGFEALWKSIGRVLARLAQPILIVIHAITSWYCGRPPLGFLRLRDGRAGGCSCVEAA